MRNIREFPTLPLSIDHVCGDFDVSEGDEEGLLLVLRQCDRVSPCPPSDGRSEGSTEARHCHQRGISKPGTEHLTIEDSGRGAGDWSTIVKLSETLQTPLLPVYDTSR